MAGAGLFQLLATSGLVAGAQPETLMGSNPGPKTGIAHCLMVGVDTCIQPGYKLLWGYYSSAPEEGRCPIPPQPVLGLCHGQKLPQPGW